MTISSLFPHGWQHYLLGGVLIGAGTALLFVLTGRIGGMSTVFSSSWSFVVRRGFFQQARFIDSRGWRLVYAAGRLFCRLRGAAGQRLHLGPRHLRAEVAATAFAAGGADVHGDGVSHGQSGRKVAGVSGAGLRLARWCKGCAPKPDTLSTLFPSTFQRLCPLTTTLSPPTP